MNAGVLGIIQARMSSNRLPGKVLMKILGKPMLELQIERIRRSVRINRLIVATSVDDTDDPIETLCIKIGIPCFRGSLTNVLDRFFQAAKIYQPSHIVRLTGDCPLTDPEIIDRVIHLHLKKGYDYTSNTLPPTWPDGMDVEILRYSCLEEAATLAELPSEREHVTPFIRNHPEKYKCGNLRNVRDISCHRLTVDEIVDFDKAKQIYTSLYPENSEFSLGDVIHLVECNPALSMMNAKVDCYNGMRESEKKDKEYLLKRENNVN